MTEIAEGSLLHITFFEGAPSDFWALAGVTMSRGTRGNRERTTKLRPLVGWWEYLRRRYEAPARWNDWVLFVDRPVANRWQVGDACPTEVSVALARYGLTGE